MNNIIDGTRLQALAASIAENLPGGWAIRSDKGNATCVVLQGADEAELWVRSGYDVGSGRIEVRGAYPAGTYQNVYNYAHFETTASADRDPAAIARQVEKRVLAGYLPELERVVQSLATGRARQESAEHEARSLVQYAGRGRVREPNGTAFTGAEGWAGSVAFRTFDGERFSIDRLYDLTAEQVRAIVDMVNANDEAAASK